MLNEFLARGGGVVVIHAGIVSRDPDWFKTIVGGAWRNGTARWLEGPMHLYFTDPESPITKDASNWEMDDEIYWDLEMMPDVRILASAYTPKAAGAWGSSAAKTPGRSRSTISSWSTRTRGLIRRMAATHSALRRSRKATRSA